MQISPGLHFLLARVYLLSIPLVLLGIRRELLSRGILHVSFPVFIAFNVAALPIVGVVRVITRRRRDARNAQANIAMLAPRIRGRLPGNLDVLTHIMSELMDGHFGDAFLPYCEEYGPIINTAILGQDRLLTTEPNHIKEILCTNFDNFEKGVDIKYALQSVFGTGVFNSDGEMWKFHRGLTRPHLTRQKVTDFNVFDRHCLIAIDQMKARLKQGYPVNIQDLLNRFTMDSATEFLLGCSADTLSTSLPYPHNYAAPPRKRSSHPSGIDPEEFSEAFRAAQMITGLRIHFGENWPLKELFSDKTSKSMKIVSSFIDPIVDAALESRKNWKEEEGKDNADNATLLDHLIADTSDAQVLKDETLNLLIAGRDTTASTLTFAIHFLGLYPKVFERLRKEVLDKIGPSRRPTWEEIKDMKYLRAVLNETLRLYPVVPINAKRSKEACLFPSPTPDGKPIYVPANTNVFYSVFIMHQRKDLWGPDAAEFDPDRFLDDRLEKYLLKNPFIFLPFNAGPRICLGQQFAYNEMSLWVVRFLQAFSSLKLDKEAVDPVHRPPKEWANSDGRKGIDGFRPLLSLTLSIRGGMWIHATEDDG